MAGTVSFGGVGSGIDVNTLVNGLVGASQGPINQMKSQAQNLTSANTSLSNIGSLLGKLQTALEAIDTTKEAGAYAATSSQSAIAVSASGLAMPGSYNISVNRLASEQRTYSDGQSSSSAAIGSSGNLNISVAGAAATAIAIDASDSLDSIAAKINASGLRVSASVFSDGTAYRLQVAGLDTGAANTIAFSGVTLGLDPSDTTKGQQAKDSEISIDGFTVTRSTNQVTGAILGVSLNLTSTTTSAVNVKIATDSSGLTSKLNSVVSAYNAVVDAVHSAAGYGTTKATVAELSGDSLLRSLTTRMSGAVGTVVGTGNYATLGAIGVKLDRDGHMSVDSAKLNAALQADPTAVAKVIAGPTDGNDGAADVLRDVAKSFAQSITGLIPSRQTSMQSRIKTLNDRINREQDRLDAYADSLRKQFTELDKVSSTAQTNAAYLTNFFK